MTRSVLTSEANRDLCQIITQSPKALSSIDCVHTPRNLRLFALRCDSTAIAYIVAHAVDVSYILNNEQTSFLYFTDYAERHQVVLLRVYVRHRKRAVWLYAVLKDATRLFVAQLLFYQKFYYTSSMGAIFFMQ